MSRIISELAFDLHIGLSALQVTEFDDLKLIGMASTLAIHIKGLGEIEYEILRKVSDHFMSIPSIALEKVLLVLEEVEFVILKRIGTKINLVVPNIPVFDDVYETIGSYASTSCTLNAHEQATLLLLESLQDSPQNVDALFNKLGIERNLFNRCLDIGTQSSIFSEYTARGKKILISPYYFADNLDNLADAAAACGADAISSTLQKVKDNQGWPMSLVKSRREIGGTQVNQTELAIIDRLSAEGILKPPTIKFSGKEESFLFTPRPGNTRLNAANKEIYERSMALVSAVRKGQLLPDKYKIKMPLRILEALRDRGFLRSNSEADSQYCNLVSLRVGYLKKIGSSRWQFHLHKTDENKNALDLAINLLKVGSLANVEINEEARIALTKDESYVQSLISSANFKLRQKEIHNQEAQEQFEQMLLTLK